MVSNYKVQKLKLLIKQIGKASLYYSCHKGLNRHSWMSLNIIKEKEKFKKLKLFTGEGESSAQSVYKLIFWLRQTVDISKIYFNCCHFNSIFQYNAKLNLLCTFLQQDHLRTVAFSKPPTCPGGAFLSTFVWICVIWFLLPFRPLNKLNKASEKPLRQFSLSSCLVLQRLCQTWWKQ